MRRTIGVFGAGPGLGQAVARRYARDGYDAVLVGRRREPLEQLAQELAGAHAIVGDLSRTDAIPALADEIHAAVGPLDALYYAPTADGGFVSAAELTPRRAAAFMPLAVYSLLALVQQFLPHMLEQGAGAILTAQGASTVQGLPGLSGPGPAQAAQRNYLQSLHAEVADRGVYVGMLYVGAIIEQSAFHRWIAESGSDRDWGPTVDPAHLAELLRQMHDARGPAESTYPG
jgi:short-subunit dehydrogenase